MVNVKVVGSGCPTCEKLAQMVRDTAQEAGVEISLEKVTDVNRFADLGLALTPGLIIDDDLKSSGKLPTESTLKQWLKKADSGS